ncbi:hypothetical protein AUC70_04540 [Methyloceanibacter stevinii]|uniref:Uncharacterized protein n=1 Tax=Methyloceanibacter stevinii TaxID=1774970 RepID=A0A1E3VNF3_9HYPH|nr:hypothetical protein AUC70_04540 [Methyloceanibacter stevinii]
MLCKLYLATWGSEQLRKGMPAIVLNAIFFNGSQRPKTALLRLAEEGPSKAFKDPSKMPVHDFVSLYF